LKFPRQNKTAESSEKWGDLTIHSFSFTEKARNAKLLNYGLTTRAENAT
jgi:hypothetical protein